MRFKQYLTELESKYTIYIDMDGVLCDFIKSASKATGKPLKDFTDWMKIREFAWKKVSEKGVDFWSNLDWTPDGKKLWNYIQKYNPNILSAHPVKSPNKEYALKGKPIWIKNNLQGVDKIYLVKGIDKQKYANSTSILIDDAERNIKQWESKGGIGILHKNTEDTIKQLKELGLRDLKNL
jgi:phosphoglycolate phosphatase-like HAD superfamily hydrolase